MPPDDIPDNDLHMGDGASSESHTDHTVTTRILGKRPREGGEPNSDEGQVRFLLICYASPRFTLIAGTKPGI